MSKHNRHNRGVRYEDDEELNKALEELKMKSILERQAAEQPGNQENQPEVDNTDEDDGVDNKFGSDYTSYAPQEEIKELIVPKCPCCLTSWLVVGRVLSQPGCGCAIHPFCVKCEKCEPHCQCRSPKVVPVVASEKEAV